MTTLDTERFDDLLGYLRENGHLARGETPRLTSLPGGVSNRTVLVERLGGDSFVIKQALEKLRVETEWHSDPRRVHQEAMGLVWLEQTAPAGTITPLLFEDPKHHLLAMRAVPRPHENWKARLLAGRLETKHVEQFGSLLGTIHRRSQEQPRELAVRFQDRSFFESLRIEPYYRFTALQQPAAAQFLADLTTETAAVRIALVHGDYSPKNVLIYGDNLVLLDHEVVHFGDPTFDLGFALTHFLSKAHHLPAHRKCFLLAARSFWDFYQQTAVELAATEGFEARAAKHSLACLLARVDGRSPLEYLTPGERQLQRTIVLSLMARPPKELPAVIDAFGNQLG